ncbi:MAG TPA: ATP synthase subunit I [Candidatus Acidoferrales bacterium]|nr:ATP synthase subunit I [Candidatus Acidoferrales bacterium]
MTDERHLARAIDRIWKTTLAIGAAGTVGLFAWRGWTWALGFVLGCAISAVNFRWVKQVAASTGSATAKPRMAVFLGLRYVLLGGCSYAIFKLSAISLSAFFWGLFAAVAAVVFEILIELVYARNGTVDH